MATWLCGVCGGENPDGMKFCGHCGMAAEVAARAEEHGIAEALRSFVAGPVADKLVEAGGRLPEERRLITALFADVSGFTSLADRLDPEQLLEVIDPVIAGLSSVVGRYGGYVEKFAGDALMALFGAPVSHEDDAARALRVALEMHEELARLVEGLPHDAELTLHVGINSGHGIARILGSDARMDYAVLGDAVILAQRFESAAPPGETYVSETTVRLTEADFEFEPVGELTLKGKAEPVPAWRLVRPRERRALATRAALIGREPEPAVFDDALAALAGGAGGVLAVTGEAGIGKSRLVAAGTDRAVAMGARCIHARCISYGAALAYWPYLDVVRHATDLRSDEKPAQTRARLDAALAEVDAAAAAPFFARVLGLPLEDEVATLEPEAFRRKLHDAFRLWLARLAAAKSLVLVLEDVHWADTSSLALSVELAHFARDHAILLVLVGRPEARAEIERLAEDVALASIELGPFDRKAITPLAEALLGGTVPWRLVSFVERRTSGNPLFVQELLRALRDSDALTLSDSGWTIRRGWDARRLPPTIEGVLAARIDLLPREAAALLQTASVIGRRARVDLLAAVAGELMTEEGLEELVRSGFLDRLHGDGEPVVVFHHALVQDAAYSRLLRRRRRELHLRVADAAEAMFGSGDHVIDLLARHLYLGESPKAREYLLRAGRRARDLFANEAAILHFTRTLELTPDDHETRLSLGDLQELVGEYEQAHESYRQVRDATDDVRAWRGLAASLRRRGDYVATLETVDEAFANPALAATDLAPLWLEAGWSRYNMGRIEEAIDVLEAGIEASAEENATLGHLFAHLAHAEILASRFGDALAHAQKARALLERHGDLRGVATATRVIGDAHRLRGEVDQAAESLRAGLQIAERIGSVEEIGGSLINLGAAEQARGALEEAIACDRRAVEEFERVGHGSGRAIAYSNLGFKLANAGAYEEAIEMCERAGAVAEAIGSHLTLAEISDTLALIELRRGHSAAAATRAEEAAEQFLKLGSNRRASEVLTFASTAWAEAGELERADAARAKAHSVAAVV
jgi:class 3 adenylate cyclase/tetratricopeptide (TPR) repeat protein